MIAARAVCAHWILNVIYHGAQCNCAYGEPSEIANRLNCRLGRLPLSYLGLPVSDSLVRIKELRPVVDRVRHRVDPWQGRLMNKAGKSVLITSSLTSLPMFAMSLYMFPEGAHADMDKFQSRFFWQGEADKQKYHMVKWQDICMPKDKGGLGITSTRRMNLCLMTKWIWRIVRGDGGLWLDLIRAKYLRGQSFSCCADTRGSQFWQAIQTLKPIFRMGAVVAVNRGTDTLFWLDCWFGNDPLRVQFPLLFAITEQPAIMVATAVEDQGRNLSFRRSLGPSEAAEWLELSALIANVILSLSPDVTSWKLDPSGLFSTKSLYDRLATGEGQDELKALWKAKLPPKIKVFLWQLIRGRLPSGDQVQKRNGPGDGICPLCGVAEDLNHILFYCVSAQFMWSCFREVWGNDWYPTSFPEWH